MLFSSFLALKKIVPYVRIYLDNIFISLMLYIIHTHLITCKQINKLVEVIRDNYRKVKGE